MHINPYLFILARTPYQVVWNYKNHTQFELDEEHSARLAHLISTPEHFDSHNSIDAAFLEAGIMTSHPSPEIDWGWDDLSKIFHIGTKDIPFEQMPEDAHQWSAYYLAHCDEVLTTEQPRAGLHAGNSDTLIFLPHPSPAADISATLASTLLTRKTSRSFTGEAIALDEVGTLLYLSLGYLKAREDAVDACVPENLRARRSSPSGGGLNACEGYLYARNIDGLAPGLYAYHPDAHALSPVNPLPDQPLGQLLCGQHFIDNLPCGLFITSRFDKLWWKYPHSRAYRMAYVEAGHISQTFQLLATAMGLDTWLTGALTDQRVETLLGLENNAEQPLFFVGCGPGNGHAQCQELNALINTREPR
ncbi:SagB family peptide dehydrogenase [Pseudomonas purpurea]|uniref:SagB family peptide dehydrogenase n=1 Tax=Pseudomonas purpurea TaxID=3136737 RepID=UPI003262D60C